MKDEAIMVECLAQGHKRRDRPGRDSNPHSDNTWGQFHRAAKQRKLLTRNICLADFLGYQPNLHVKLMYFGWLSVLKCLAKIFAKQNSLISSSMKLGPELESNARDRSAMTLHVNRWWGCCSDCVRSNVIQSSSVLFLSGDDHQNKHAGDVRRLGTRSKVHKENWKWHAPTFLMTGSWSNDATVWIDWNGPSHHELLLRCVLSAMSKRFLAHIVWRKKQNNNNKNHFEWNDYWSIPALDTFSTTCTWAHIWSFAWWKCTM